MNVHLLGEKSGKKTGTVSNIAPSVAGVIAQKHVNYLSQSVDKLVILNGRDIKVFTWMIMIGSRQHIQDKFDCAIA